MVISLVAPIRPPVHEELVKMLNDMLGRAKSGELQTLCAVGQLSDGDRLQITSIAKGTDFVLLLGQVARLERKLNLMIEANAES